MVCCHAWQSCDSIKLDDANVTDKHLQKDEADPTCCLHKCDAYNEAKYYNIRQCKNLQIA